MKKIILFIILLFLPTWVMAADCGGATPCACGDTVTSSYTLTGNLSCTNAGNALNIGANSVVLDLGGYTISGDGVAGHVVVGVDNPSYTDVEIKNGTITLVTTSGTDFYGASTGIVSDIICSHTGNQGFQNRGTANVVYNRIAGSNNVDDGFSMHDSAIAVINTGTFNSNAQGINIIASSTLTGYDIVLLDNTDISIYTTAPTGTRTITLTIDELEFNTKALLRGAVSTLTNFYAHDIVGNHAIDTTEDTVAPGNIVLQRGKIVNIAANKFGVTVRSGSAATIDNVTIADVTKTGKGIFSAVNLDVRNSIFYNLVTGITQVSGTVSATNSDFYGNTGNTSGTVTLSTCLTVDPQFVDAANKNYNLQKTSSLINAGTDVGLSYYSTAPDIGAYEYIPKAVHRR